MFESRFSERSTLPDFFFLTKHICTTGSRLSGRVFIKGAHVCMNSMYGWIPSCKRIIENKRNKTKKKICNFAGHPLNQIVRDINSQRLPRPHSSKFTNKPSTMECISTYPTKISKSNYIFFISQPKQMLWVLKRS